MKASDILNKARQHMEDRAAERDQPEGERSMSRTIAAFNALTGHALSERDGWMFMVLLKTARACNTPTGVPDDYEDGAAYFALAGEAAYVAGFPFGEQTTDTKVPPWQKAPADRPSEAQVLATLEDKQKVFDDMLKYLRENFPLTLAVPRMLNEEDFGLPPGTQAARRHRNQTIREIVAMNPQLRVVYP